MHCNRLLTMSVSAVFFIACGSDGADQAARVVQQATLPQALCDLLPLADAERIMGKSLVQQRNDDSGCHYQDARGTTGTGLWVHLNAFEVSDQCRLTPGSEPLSGVGDEACIAIGQPAGGRPARRRGRHPGRPLGRRGRGPLGRPGAPEGGPVAHYQVSQLLNRCGRSHQTFRPRPDPTGGGS